MKHVSGIVCCALLMGFGAGTLAAQPISVQVTGHIVQWQDNTGLIGPNLPLSLPVTATYTYDPSGPITPVGPGQDSLPASSTSIAVTMGQLTFQTGPASRMEAQITQGVPGSTWGMVLLQGYQNPALPNGVDVDFIGINFMDPTGQWPTSSELPASVPNLTSYASSQIVISGPNTATGYFQITAQIDSVQLLPPAVEVSPQAGSFIPQQHFDAVVLLPLGRAPVATMQASVGGSPLALNYPGTCQLTTPTSSGRSALLCQVADAALVSLQGVTQIDWQVTLADGSSFTQSVQWNLIH
jgi:hypothetical protein